MYKYKFGRLNNLYISLIFPTSSKISKIFRCIPITYFIRETQKYSIPRIKPCKILVFKKLSIKFKWSTLVIF